MIAATILPFLATPFETNAVTKIRLMTYDLAQKAREACARVRTDPRPSPRVTCRGSLLVLLNFLAVFSPKYSPSGNEVLESLGAHDMYRSATVD